MGVEHFHASGGASRDAINLVMARAGPLLLQLTGVPQCRAKAIEVMRSLCQQMVLECSTLQILEDQGSAHSEASTAPGDTDVNRSHHPKGHGDSETASPTIAAFLVPSGVPSQI